MLQTARTLRVENRRLRRENERLRQMLVMAAERIAAQHQILQRSSRAKKKETP